MRYLPFVFAILILACSKADRDNDTSTVQATDNLLAEFAFIDIHTMIKEATEAESGLRSVSNLFPNATIYSDTLSNPKIVMIDFGSSNSLCADGRNRRGIIYASLSGHYSDSLCQIQITPQNYYVQDRKIEGAVSMTNNGRISGGYHTFSWTVTNGKVTDTDGSVIQYNCSRNFKWLTGIGTSQISDDIYTINGTASGLDRKGASYTSSITASLNYNFSCSTFTSGILKIQVGNLSDRIIDFGSGNCDQIATLSFNGNEEELATY